MNLAISNKGFAREKMRGLTVAEMIISVTVFSIFFTLAFQVYTFMENQRLVLLRKTIANEVANINLKKFPNLPASLPCSTDPNGIDLKTSNNYSDETTSTYPALATLGSTTTQSVKGFPLGGCNGNNFVSGMLRVESKVTYSSGTYTTTIMRVAYISS